MERKTSSTLAEFKVFRTFVESSSFEDVVEEFGNSEDASISGMVSDEQKKKALEESFKVFKSATKDLNLSSNLEDYSNPDVLNKLNSEIQSEMYPFNPSEKVSSSGYSLSVEKIKIGSMLLEYAEFMEGNGKDIMSEYRKEQEKLLKNLKHEQARVNKYGTVKHGSFSRTSVFSTESRK